MDIAIKSWDLLFHWASDVSFSRWADHSSMSYMSSQLRHTEILVTVSIWQEEIKCQLLLSSA